MDKLKILKRLLIFQALSPIAIAFVIKIFQPPAEVAGALFIFVGLVVFTSLFKQSNLQSSTFFITTLLYLFTSIFLFGGSLSHRGQELSDFTFLTIPATWIHHLTETLYFSMVALTIFEIFKAKKQKSLNTEVDYSKPDQVFD